MVAGHSFKLWIYEVRTQTNQAALYQGALMDIPKSVFFLCNKRIPFKIIPNCDFRKEISPIV